MVSSSSAAFSFFVVLSLLHNFVLAAPLDAVASHHSSCKQLLPRMEWYASPLFFPVDVTSLKLVFRRDLGDEEKKGYIDAVKCLQSLPAQNPVIPAAKTRFDEFHAHHIKIAEQVHYVVSIGRGNTL